MNLPWLFYTLLTNENLQFLTGGIDEASRVWLESRTIKIDDDDYGAESGASSEEIGIPTKFISR